ncbi:zinc ion binding [Branchiostoma belcheri]|nr:zinc ion binding [Branchiostoma belcheri]
MTEGSCSQQTTGANREDRFEEAHERKAKKYRDQWTSTDDVVEAKHAATLYQVNPNLQSITVLDATHYSKKDGDGDFTVDTAVQILQAVTTSVQTWVVILTPNDPVYPTAHVYIKSAVALLADLRTIRFLLSAHNNIPSSTKVFRRVVLYYDDVKHDIQDTDFWKSIYANEERKDTSPGDVKESLQDALSGASAEHSAQDHVPGHSTDDGTERPSLPTVCPSHTNIGKTDQNQAFHSEKPSLPETCTMDTHVDPVKENQALCADNSQEKAEQQSSTEIYDAEGYNENNVAQYQVRDTCVKEVSSTAYQCSEDVDEASIGIDCSKRGAEGLDQPVAKQLEDAENSYQNEFELEEEVTADDSCIRPYAVAYQPDSKTNGEEDGIFDVQPYAVAYDEQDINYDEQQPTTGQSADCSHGERRGPNTSLAESVAGKTDGLLRNPMYIGNVLHQNPMYAPNAAQPRADGENENKDLEQKTIIFQLKCEESSDCSGVNSVAVSPCNEIFLADTFNRQVQVFSMKGVSLRSFPTVTSGENSETLKPHDISIDGEGHVWVVGNAYRMSGFIVRYTKLGSHLTTLRATFSNNSLSGMTVDTLRNLVVATEHWWGYREVKLLHFNGTVEHKFRVQQGSGYPGVVAVGREGNLFVSDDYGDARVHVYNNRSQYLYSFGGDDIDEGRSKIGLGQAKMGEGQTEIDLGKTEIGEGITEADDNEADEVMGIRTDGSGNVLLVRSGGAVDMFTEDGRYVRRVVTSRAVGVAVAPGGQLVVTAFDTSNVTIFYQY